MTYADTDFFLALLKPSDWLREPAEQFLTNTKEMIWTSPTALVELLLLSRRTGLDPVRLLLDALQIAELRHGDQDVYLRAAHYLKEHEIGVFDALHASFCESDSIISSDKVFDRLGLKRVVLEPDERSREDA